MDGIMAKEETRRELRGDEMIGELRGGTDPARKDGGGYEPMRSLGTSGDGARMRAGLIIETTGLEGPVKNCSDDPCDVLGVATGLSCNGLRDG